MDTKLLLPPFVDEDAAPEIDPFLALGLCEDDEAWLASDMSDAEVIPPEPTFDDEGPWRLPARLRGLPCVAVVGVP